MNLVDAICYVIFVIIIFVVILTEYNHHVCNSLKCKLVDWSEEQSVDDRDFYMKLLQLHASQSNWKRALIIASVLSLVVYLWMQGGLPGFMHFLALVAFFFIVLYFSLVYYQHHQFVPIANTVRSFMYHSCDKKDGRDESEIRYGTLQVPPE